MASEDQSQVQQPVSAEEEALKRNTDCVYFLASPLTCKKGSECEYRHSEIARVNPRDCWYWLNSNCLNPKCAFRHPPLEGFVGAQTTTSTGPSIPQTQTAPATTPYVASASGKQGVPCVFFQKGYCLKGDWCPFLHVPNSSSNKSLQVAAHASAAEPATIKKAIVGSEKSIQEKKAQTLPVANQVKAKANAEVETAIPKNKFTLDRRVQQASVVNDFITGYRSVPPISNGTQVKWSNRVQHSHLLDEPESMNSKDEEEVSREPSPGFDVLVDNEGRDSDYYPGEDRHGMSGEHEMNEYDIGQSNDYIDHDDEIYREPIGYDSHERYAWDQQRVSSERISGVSYRERMPHTRNRNDGDVQVVESDLMHRLLRQKKPDGLRSVISWDTPDVHAQDRSHQGLYEYRNERDNNALSSRLRGRIRLPAKSSSPANGNINSFPVRMSVAQGRIRDRIKERVEDSYNNGLRAHRGSNFRRDDVQDDKNVDFAGPKSLAELKNKKIAETRVHDVADNKHFGKRKHSMVDENHQSGVSSSFDGPKSLEEILKRKRGEYSGTKSVKDSSNNEHGIKGKTLKEENDSTEKEFNNSTSSHKNEDEENKSKSTNTSIETTKEGEHVVDHGADLEAEAHEQNYDYEQTGGEDYEYYDGENGDDIEEYVEDEDEDDDFAKKMGVMYS